MKTDFRKKNTGRDGITTHTNLCVVGATGKFGRSIISAADSEITITGAVSSNSNPLVGRPLSELGLEVILSGAADIANAAATSDVILFVSKPDADLNNIPKVASLRKRIVVGTTGFSPAEIEKLRSMLKDVPSVVTSNFAVGANILFKIAKQVSRFSELYDYSIIEQHHKSKTDVPSGTAKTIHEMLNMHSSFPKIVTDRTAKPQRNVGEIEILSLRGGGTPGIHQLILAGDHDMLLVQHLAFSRAAAATGALIACKWIMSVTKPGIYSMQDVLNLNAT